MDQRYVGPIPGRQLIFDIEKYGKGDHCCNEMNIHVHEKEKVIGYYLPTRLYVIRINEFTTQQLKFCPWCGAKLPKVLDQEYNQIVSKILNISIEDISPEVLENSNLPQEFKTDEWWKKRGL